MNSIISLNLDSFIYAVRQAFDARSRPQGEFDSHLKYTPFLENTWEKPSESSVSALSESLDAIFLHHFRAIPHYQRHEQVNLENIAWFAHSIAALFADMNYLLKNVMGHGIPQKNADDAESTEIWALINQSLQKHFQEYAVLFNAYADWKYNTSTEKKETVDWNVRPPCGLLYKTEFKSLFDEMRKERFGKKSFQSKHDKHDNKHNKQEKHDKHDKQDKNDRPPHHQREKGPRDRRDSKRPPETSVDTLEPALDECKKAIETIKSNPNIHEIPLSPQNSFVRKHQHTFITEAGFNSDSRGEGAGRYVCIIQQE